MTPSITHVERIAPKVVKIDHRPVSQRIPWYVWAVLVGVLIATIIHFTIEPKPAQALTPDLYSKSDKEQEAEFCRQIGRGTPVLGSNVSQIELHCMTHGG